MKVQHQLSRIACALLASGLALPAAAADRAPKAERADKADKDSGVYMNVDVGVNWAEDVHVNVEGISGNADLDVGSRLGIGVGYNFNKYLGVEFDTGWLWNEFSSTDSSLSHLPFMLNGVFRYTNETGFEPYVGGGIGGSVNIVYLDDFGINDTDSEFDFAWQALAGLRYRFRNHMSVGVGYKYFGTTDSGYHLDGVHVKLGTSNNHTLDFQFNVQF